MSLELTKGKIFVICFLFRQICRSSTSAQVSWMSTDKIRLEYYVTLCNVRTLQSDRPTKVVRIRVKTYLEIGSLRSMIWLWRLLMDYVPLVDHFRSILNSMTPCKHRGTQSAWIIKYTSLCCTLAEGIHRWHTVHWRFAPHWASWKGACQQPGHSDWYQI